MKLNNPNVKSFPKWFNDDLAVFSAGEKALEKGENEFICPVCGGKATVVKSEYNGHVKSFCSSCKRGMFQ